MEIRGRTICGHSAVQIRNVFRIFIEKTAYSFENGELKMERKELTADFLATELGLVETEGESVFAGLVADGYIDKDRLTPTHRGMALAHAEDRDRLSFSVAEEILNQFLDAVREANAQPGARVIVERVHVFGSYLMRAETVGDIDLFIEMTLPTDLEPEDIKERDAIMEKIMISQYLSLHDELDLVAIGAEKRTVYDRANAT